MKVGHRRAAGRLPLVMKPPARADSAWRRALVLVASGVTVIGCARGAHSGETERRSAGSGRRHPRTWRRDQVGISDARKASSADQMVADADQSASDADQLSSDPTRRHRIDQTGADGISRHRIWTRRRPTGTAQPIAISPRCREAYESSRGIESSTFERLGNRFRRQATSRPRQAATDRDRMAEIRDEGGRGGDAHATDLSCRPANARPSADELEELRAQAAADRSGRPRSCSSRFRQSQGGPRTARLKSSSRPPTWTSSPAPIGARWVDWPSPTRSSAYDGGRAIGRGVRRCRQAEEGERSRRPRRGRSRAANGGTSDPGAVAFVRPIIRYGGDEFVCGLGGTDLADAERRFESIRSRSRGSCGRDQRRPRELEPGDIADGLTERADAAMLRIRAARRTSPSGS